MNATTPLADPPAPVTPAAGSWSATDIVRLLSVEQKHGLLVALLREAMAVYGERGQISIPETVDGESGTLGYFTPAAATEAARQRWLATLSPEVREAVTRPLGDIDLDDCIPIEELMGRHAPVS